jgi:hypothetical protein
VALTAPESAGIAAWAAPGAAMARKPAAAAVQIVAFNIILFFSSMVTGDKR